MKLNFIKSTLSCAALCVIFSCGGAAKTPETIPEVIETSVAPELNDPCAAGPENVCATEIIGNPSAQIEKGNGVWLDECSVCHGDNGEGAGKALPVIGEGSLARFTTALDLDKYIMQSMPKTDPGSLSVEDSAAVTAWILSARGVTLDSPLNEASAEFINL